MESDTKTQNRRADDDLSQRVAATESDIRHISEDVEKLSAEVHGGFVSLNKAISGLGEKLSVKSQTPWTLIISGLSLVITVITLIGVLGVGIPQQKQAVQIKEQNELVFDHITSKGHPALQEKVLNQGVRIEVVNDELKREMRQLDAAIVELLSTKIAGVVDKFNSEIANTNKQVGVLNQIQLDKYQRLDNKYKSEQ